jgi:Uma2 family endonuclease
VGAITAGHERLIDAGSFKHGPPDREITRADPEEKSALATIAPPAEQRIVLHDIAWETYERLLTDHVDRSVPHFTYDHGDLEIVTPSIDHERDNRTLDLLVEIVASEWSIDIINVGSATFKRRDLEQGFEPDTGFYIQHEEDIRGKTEIDLLVDPPPDLVIEIEVTLSAIPKLPLYARMGIPEVWRLHDDHVTILRLADIGYRETLTSEALAPLTSAILTDLLHASHSLRRTVWMRQLQQWAQGTQPSLQRDILEQ